MICMNFCYGKKCSSIDYIYTYVLYFDMQTTKRKKTWWYLEMVDVIHQVILQPMEHIR